MSPEKQRIAIAEYLNLPKSTVCPYCKGNTPYEAGDDYGITLWEECKHCSNTGKVKEYFVRFPYFTADLNAMHEAEKTLTLEQWDKYIDRLGDWVPSMRNVAHATAAQRAEAFLRTLNLWTNEQ